ncbi:MAG: DUF4124 domain-containing protein [Oleiphilaceae bacterium]|nr:DUF4124 domain-containing protein [Oleiphilaceae bacterium]
MTTASMLLATFLLTLPMTAAAADVYRHVDQDGNVTYSDEPRDDAEAVDVQPVTTVKLPSMDDIESPQAEETANRNADQAPYQRITFSAPEDDEAFWSGSGNIEFAVSSEPPLKEGHRYEVTLDGQIVGQSRSGNIAVQNVFRGTHEAQVAVVDNKGRPVQKGESIAFTIHRPSVQN